MKIARERKSSVLASNAVHHRVDSLTSIVALATIGGAHVFTNASWLDPVGGLLISAMVIRAGWGNTKASLLELADVTVDDEVKSSVRRSANKVIQGDATDGLVAVEHGDQVEVRDIQGVKSGQNYLIDIELAVPRSFTLQQMDAVETAVRDRAGSKVRGVRRVRVKFVSSEDTDTTLASDFIDTSVSPRSSPEPEDEHDHDHDHGNHHQHSQENGHIHHHEIPSAKSSTTQKKEL
jgi:divalent metal cation (Fe/Co/Zn/Cd) transporter